VAITERKRSRKPHRNAFCADDEAIIGRPKEQSLKFKEQVLRIKSLFLGSTMVSIAVALLAGCGPRPTDTTTSPKAVPKQAASGVQSGTVKVGDADIQYFSQGEGEAAATPPTVAESD
jgi:hypothetical protein